MQLIAAPSLKAMTESVRISALESRTAVLLLLVVSALFGWILLPLYGPILWSAVIALLFAPVYRGLLPRLGRRRWLAATVTLALVLLGVVLPFAFVMAALAREVSSAYQRIASGQWQPALILHSAFDALPDWLTPLLDSMGMANYEALQHRLTVALGEFSHLILATQTIGLGVTTFGYLARVFLTLYLTFFFVRDGRAMTHRLLQAVPLASRHKRELLRKFNTVVRATVKGTLLVAAIQGSLSGIAFWYLGVPSPLLWAVTAACLSLVPAVGSALVWGPVAVYFLFAGAIAKAVALTAFGVLVIGLVDNVVRPILVGRDTRMPDYLVMISTVGGIASFGLNGFILGPALAAVFLAIWHIYGGIRREQLAHENSEIERITLPSSAVVDASP